MSCSSLSSVITLTRSSSSCFIGSSMRAGCGYAQALLHDGAGGRVLQELPLFREQVMLNTERRQRRLMKSAQDQLLLAGIGVDVADREDARHAGLEFFGVHLECLLLEFDPPFGDRTELRVVERPTGIQG